jgi:hypothetical protein
MDYLAAQHLQTPSSTTQLPQSQRICGCTIGTALVGLATLLSETTAPTALAAGLQLAKPSRDLHRPCMPWLS